MGTLSRGAVTIAILTTNKKVVLVRDPSKPRPLYWKFCVGGIDPGETPVEVALREMDEEIGLTWVQPDQLVLLGKENRGDHGMYFFGTIIDTLGIPYLPKKGRTGEDVGVFDLAELDWMRDFAPWNRAFISSLRSPSVVSAA